jgi:hypothetical protein
MRPKQFGNPLDLMESNRDEEEYMREAVSFN